MKLAFVLPPILLGERHLDFTAIDTSPRGTTGSEIQILTMAQEMAKRDHAVDFFIPYPNEDKWGRVAVLPFQELGRKAECYDAIISSVEVNLFRDLPGDALRVVCQQLNSFNYGAPGFENFVDVFVSPSRTHKVMLERTWPMTVGKWEVIPNGCYPFEYGWVPSSEREQGYVAYISSPDRGLHLVLQEWPRIRRAVPHAHLRIFYWSLKKWLDECAAPIDPRSHPWVRESHRRANYIRGALELLEGQGVEVVGSVSRTRMREELLRVDVQAFPCDVVAWTEGFSCATLEGCAAGALPVIAATDALGELYRGYTPCVDEPGGKHIDEWRDLLIRGLTDRKWADEWRLKGRQRAREFQWQSIAADLEKLLTKKKRSTQ